jgi:hypothetical protein
VVNGEYLASEFDNIFYNTALININKAISSLFTQTIHRIRKANTISDHIPIWIEFTIK